MTPGGDQDNLRDQFSNSLEAVISQELLPKVDKKSLVLACEVLIATPAVRRSIREGKIEQIHDILQTGSSQGMISKDAAIKVLYQKRDITRDTALEHMRNPVILGS